MLSIYDYTDAAAFLKDVWKEKKKRNPSFSMRSWAKRLGFENNAPLSLMLNGKRPISSKYLLPFIKSLELSAKDGTYLESLIALSNAKTPEQKSFYLERLKRLSPKACIQMVEIETFKCIADPLHATLIEMTELNEFEPDPVWIRSRIQTKVNLTEIQESLDRVISLGLLKEDRNGLLKKTHKHFTTRPDFSDRGVVEYHQKTSLLASEAIQKQAVLEREFNAYALNIRKSDLDKAKALVRDFAKKFINAVEAPPGLGEETYQLNIQFFGLTKHEGERK